MEQVAISRAALNFPNQGFPNRLLAQLEIDQLVAPHFLEGLDEVTTIHRHGDRVDVVPVNNGGQAALATERL
jgi:hypothetical protein